ncbi:MAG: NAD(P)/FAD-dependent oxidoreductase [Syntrophales bacterium]|nr:NAD(P)/FAD-dependent oxidoreductase [Syntrophales bacterium]
MTRDKFDITIIGAGVIGLAIAEELSTKHRNILLVEKNTSYGQETSSRHSEVIHAGIYYPAGFLKATLCREGNHLLYETCRNRNIPHKMLGKLIVATNNPPCPPFKKGGIIVSPTLTKKDDFITPPFKKGGDFVSPTLTKEDNFTSPPFSKEDNLISPPFSKGGQGGFSEEINELWKIKERAEQNGVDNLSFLSQNQIHKLEPEVRATTALFSPSTGIIDSHSLMRSFYINAESNDVTIAFRSEVTAIHVDNNSYDLEINNGEYRFQTRILINSAGLHSDRIAKLAGIDIDKEGYRLKYCKGNYFSASPAPKLKHLVYPAPTDNYEGLGIHATLDLNSRVKFGPDTEYVDNLEYTVDEDKKVPFYQSIRRYLPGIKMESLNPEMSGIRPKLQGPGEPYRDFVIKEERDLGYSGLINLIGIESPGLTSCIPIARHVSSLVEACL